MSASFNHVVLMGNLTRDPELRHIPSGSPVCEFSIAINERRKKGDEVIEVAHFFDIVTWGHLANNCEKYLTKGRQVLVNGKLTQQQWEKDGQKRSKVKVQAHDVQFLGEPGQKSTEDKPETDQQVTQRQFDAIEEKAEPDPADDNLPF